MIQFEELLVSIGCQKNNQLGKILGVYISIFNLGV